MHFSIKEKPILKDNKILFALLKPYLVLLTFLTLISPIHAQDAEFWYEDQLKKMSLDQKIGQLFMVAAYSNKDDKHVSEIERLIQDYHLGGLIFMQNDPIRQAWLSNYYQSISNTPLMMSIDGEWGLAMRLKNTCHFPYALTMGALKNDSLVYAVGAAIGQQCKRLGIHINFAPDIDINVNPNNPIIGFRSFGENKFNVAKLGIAYSNGLMSENVLSCAKHFPGHGDVNTDSHLGLPQILKSKAELDSLELFPFKALITSGVPSIMVAHLFIPQYDSRVNRPASLSKYVIDTLLRQQLKYDGLVFTDALNMKGVSKFFQPGELELEALKAGNDVLLFSENIPVAFAKIKEAIINGEITETELDKHVLRILKWKQFAGLDHYTPINTKHLAKDLKGHEYDDLQQRIANEAVSIPIKSQLSLPIKSKEKVLFIALGDIQNSKWKELCNKAHGAVYKQVAKNPSNEKIQSLVVLSKGFDKVVISYHQPLVWSQGNGGYVENDLKLVSKISALKKTIVIGFFNPYIFNRFSQKVTYVAAYEDNEFFHQAAMSLIYGRIPEMGLMPVSLKMKSTQDQSSSKKINLNQLNEIDKIAAQLIQKKAAPGCRILVLKDNEMIFNRAYGHLNYDKFSKVNDSTQYDIASITKIASTTLAVMKLYEEGKIDLKKTLGDYVPMAKGTNKEHLVIEDILQHRAGLTAWIPFYKETLPFIDSVYCAKGDSAFCVKVADKLFMLKANKDTIYKRIFNSALESKTYRYSDLSMILMQMVVEQVSGMGLDTFMQINFYGPMGLRDIGYNPWKNHNTNNIAPTQVDRLFRKQELCGYVHDPAAAMLGGVSGHAGIFSTAQDLGHLMQMLADGGVYMGVNYLKPETISLFTSYQRSDSRRGLGFDKPDFSGKTSPASTL
ncbi:MAG: serine hydrolase, partial [Bacteroidia bacterium]|nr:serine hydrolase [Bacteroidia bacterium]